MNVNLASLVDSSAHIVYIVTDAHLSVLSVTVRSTFKTLNHRLDLFYLLILPILLSKMLKHFCHIDI